MLHPPSRSPSPDLLSSDDEGAPRVRPVTLRTIPHYIPPLPPKHTYLRTPVSHIVGFLIFESFSIDHFFLGRTSKESCSAFARKETQKCSTGARFTEKSFTRHRGKHRSGRRTPWRHRQLGNHHSSPQKVEISLVITDLILYIWASCCIHSLRPLWASP